MELDLGLGRPSAAVAHSSAYQQSANFCLDPPDGHLGVLGADPVAAPSRLSPRQAALCRRMAAQELGREELLSLALSFVLPEERAELTAKGLLDRFGNLSGVLGASARHLANAVGGIELISVFIKVLQGVMAEALREPALDRPKIDSSVALMDYLRMSMGSSQAELVRILFLDRKNALIKDELHARGTIDHTPLYPREVIRRVLELDAKAIILVHNHPSGDPTPSRQDIEMTNLIAQVLSQIDVALHDHVIVGAAQTLSFRKEKLL